MKRIALLVALLPLGALAASPFDGDWKTDIKTGHIIKNVESGFEIKSGTYRCTKNCEDRIDEVAADGKDHPVKNHSISDRLSVEVVNDTKAVLTLKKGTTLVSKCTLVASADAAHLTQSCTDHTGAKPVESSGTSTRVGKPDPAAHKVSGSWLADEGSWNGTELTTSIASTPNGLKFTWNGIIVDAKFDGREYLAQNDPAHSLNILKKVSDREVEWTTKILGKNQGVDRLVVAADGKSILDTYTSLTDGSSSSVVMRKQP